MGLLILKMSLTANCASDLRSAVGSHFFSQNASPEAQPLNPLMFRESFS